MCYYNSRNIVKYFLKNVEEKISEVSYKISYGLVDGYLKDVLIDELLNLIILRNNLLKIISDDVESNEVLKTIKEPLVTEINYNRLVIK